MHVCFLFHREFLQDVSTSMNEYPLKLAELGVDTTVVAARNSTAEPAHEVLEGVDVHRLLTDTSTSFSVEPTRFAYRGLRKIHELCGTENVDVLHMLAFPDLGAVLRPVPWLDSPPVTVIDVRGTAVRHPAVDALSRWAIRFQDRLVDRTLVIDRKVADNIFPDTSDVSILRLGTDLEAFTPGENPALRQEWGIDEDELVVGYTGSLHTPREIDRLLDAFDRVWPDHRETHLAIVGDGTERERLESYVRSLDAGAAIHFTGRIPYRDMPAYVRAFDVGFAYVPDRPQYRDQPPSKTVEFLAANLPVLASDTPGNRAFISHGDNGLLAADEVDAYAEQLDRLLDSTELRRSLADGARESVADYDYRTIVENELLPIYRHLLEER